MRKDIELVDLVDSKGRIQKRGIPRTEAGMYSELYLQIAICVVFDDSGRILVHQRAKTKKINPGDIDHICGGIMSGETPEEAAMREALEETGIRPLNLKIVAHGINKYNCFRYLLAGKAGGEPATVNPAEALWVRFMHVDELKAKQKSGEFTFVDEFFEDAELAIQSKTH